MLTFAQRYILIKFWTNIMAHLHTRVQAFVKLGDFLRKYCEYAKNTSDNITKKEVVYSKLDQLVETSGHKNGWFTRENVLYALESWGELLRVEKLLTWLNKYEIEKANPKTVAIIMAGNIPLVGFHDFLCTLILGNKALIKLSSNDELLLPFIADFLRDSEAGFEPEIQFQQGKLENFDSIIATGSDNTARYFEYYFRGKPSIIRRNRTSVAVLTGAETPEMLQALGEDIFRYFGLGCRSVSKLYVPDNYSFEPLFKALYPYKDIISLAKYANNYDYNKAVYLMSSYKIRDNGFLMLKEDSSYGSPIATLFYESYSSSEALKKRLDADKDAIQCIVAKGLIATEVAFGQTQCPGLDDYADAIDTVEFLLKTSHN